MVRPTKELNQMVPTDTQAPADVEVAELVRWLRENADSAANAGHHEPAEMLTFASDLLERPAKTPAKGLRDEELIAAATEAGLCYPQCWDFTSQPERLEHLRAFANSIIARCGNHFRDVKKMVGPASTGWVLMPPSLASGSTVEEVAELVTALRQVSDGANACGDEGTAWVTARAANLLEQRQGTLVIEGEMAELVRQLSSMAADAEAADFVSDAALLNRAIKYLERQAAPVPVYERDLNSILSPSGGYELREGAALTEGAQLIDGEWWAPVFGCDSMESALNRIRQRLDPFQQNGKLKNYQAFSPSPVPVSERLPEAMDCDEKGRCWVGYGEATDEYDSKDQELNPSWELCKVHPQDEFWLPAQSLPIPPQI